MEKRIDQLLIRVQGKMYFGQKLEVDQDIVLTLKGSITDENVQSNQDGSVSITYIFRGLVEDIREDSAIFKGLVEDVQEDSA